LERDFRKEEKAMTRASGSQSGSVLVSIIYPGQIDIVSTACVGPMTDKAIELDERRGMAAHKATDLRRLLADVEANETALRLRQDELEAHQIAAPAANWGSRREGALSLNLFAATLSAQDPAVLADFQRLSAEP
jgi:hypothetical protein